VTHAPAGSNLAWSRTINIHGIEETESPQASVSCFTVHHPRQAVIWTRNHITLALATCVDKRQVSIQSAAQEVLVDERLGPEIPSVGITELVVRQREADYVFVIFEVAGDLEEQLAGQADGSGARHESRRMIDSKDVFEEEKCMFLIGLDHKPVPSRIAEA
jgi:hypothetical protein